MVEVLADIGLLTDVEDGVVMRGQFQKLELVSPQTIGYGLPPEGLPIRMALR